MHGHMDIPILGTVSRSMSFLQVNDSRDVSSHFRVDIEDVSVNSSRLKFSSIFDVRCDCSKDDINDSRRISCGVFSILSANVSLIFWTALMKNFVGGYFRRAMNDEFVDSAVFDVICPNRGIGENT